MTDGLTSSYQLDVRTLSRSNGIRTVRAHLVEGYDVAICGGGPVGLALAYLLGRQGIRTVLFEKRPQTTTLPKGQSVHASTAELYRQWGVWDLLDKAGWPLSESNGQGYYLRVDLGPVAEVRQSDGSDDEYANKWHELSPTAPRKVPASDYETALRRQAAKWSSVTLRFATEVVDVKTTTDGIRLSVQDQSGGQHDIDASYLVACDGARSLIRSRTAQGEDHGPTFGNQVLTEFRADLANTLGRDGYFHSFILDPRYAGWFGSQHPDTKLWRYSFKHDEESLPEPAAVVARIRGALGMPELSIDVVQTWRFDYTTGLLRNWREGRVLFAGDAAHWHSPWGGFGANIGVQDANNLAWKLALVVRGLASAELLDTYEAERKPKAQLAVKAATYNAMNFQAIVASALVGEPAAIRDGKLSAAGEAFLREGVERHGASSILHVGFQFGTTYHSKLVMRDGASPPRNNILDYTESTVSGVRAPHVWLRDGAGRVVSTVDLWGRGFTLLAARTHVAPWRLAAAKIEVETGIPIEVVAIGPDGDYTAEEPKFERLYAVAHGDALLVRPDGFVARRLSAAGGADQLQETFMRLTCRTFTKA